MSLNERRGPRRGHVPLTSRPVRPSGRQRTAGRTTSVISSLSFADGSPSGTRGQRDRSPSTVIGRRNDAPRRVVLARRDVAQQPNLPLRRLRHESLNLRVLGSSPWRLTNKINNLRGFTEWAVAAVSALYRQRPKGRHCRETRLAKGECWPTGTPTATTWPIWVSAEAAGTGYCSRAAASRYASSTSFRPRSASWVRYSSNTRHALARAARFRRLPRPTRETPRYSSRLVTPWACTTCSHSSS